jgi:hypothetical protein
MVSSLRRLAGQHELSVAIRAFDRVIASHFQKYAWMTKGASPAITGNAM